MCVWKRKRTCVKKQISSNDIFVRHFWAVLFCVELCVKYIHIYIKIRSKSIKKGILALFRCSTGEGPKMLDPKISNLQHNLLFDFPCLVNGHSPHLHAPVWSSPDNSDDFIVITSTHAEQTNFSVWNLWSVSSVLSFLPSRWQWGHQTSPVVKQHQRQKSSTAGCLTLLDVIHQPRMKMVTMSPARPGKEAGWQEEQFLGRRSSRKQLQ